jgi:nucleoside-diphosphate-sugar epimerase
MRYLVTGGAGFIGSHTVDELVRRGHEVIVVDDLSTGKVENLTHAISKIKFIQESVVNLQALQHACRDVDCIIHLAAQTSVPRSIMDPLETNLINANGTLNVLVAAREAKVKRVVFACTCAVYGKTSALPIAESAALEPISPYGVSKQMGEAYGRVFQDLYGLEFMSLRYFNVFGPRQDPGSPYSGVLSLFNEHLLKGSAPTVYGDGEQSRDFVYVDNVVHANLLAAETTSGPFQAINVGTGNRTTLNHTLKLLAGITGRPTQANYAPGRDGDIRDSQADISLAQATLGYHPRVSFEEGLKRTWEWFSSRQSAPVAKQ